MLRDRATRVRTKSILGRLLCILWASSLLACYASTAARQSKRLLRAGFDLEERGPWVVVSAPGSVLLAGGNMIVGSMIPMTKIDPREPEAQWFHLYPGQMLPVEEVAVVCHERRSTWISGIRPVPPPGQQGDWLEARLEKWHFPDCIEVLPGSYDLQVHYFVRETDDDADRSVTRQAESIRPSTVRWNAQPGQVYRLSVEIGRPEPANGLPPQRHIPRSRSLGTSWWDLEESDFSIRIEHVAAWDGIEGPIREQRRDWARYESKID